MGHREYRTLLDSEVIIENRENEPSAIVGYAARIYRQSEPGTQFQLAPGVVERIMPGAFDKSLSRGDDVAALFNHNPDKVLGRTKSGTVVLSADSNGLKYRITPNESSSVTKEVISYIARGDITGSSFAFTIDKEEWRSEGKGDNRVDVREISNLTLYDVSPVTYPAYEATSVGLRAAGGEDWKQSHVAFREREAAALEAERETLRARAVVAGLR